MWWVNCETLAPPRISIIVHFTFDLLVVGATRRCASGRQTAGQPCQGKALTCARTFSGAGTRPPQRGTTAQGRAGSARAETEARSTNRLPPTRSPASSPTPSLRPARKVVCLDAMPPAAEPCFMLSIGCPRRLKSDASSSISSPRR